MSELPPDTYLRTSPELQAAARTIMEKAMRAVRDLKNYSINTPSPGPLIRMEITPDSIQREGTGGTWVSGWVFVPDPEPPAGVVTRGVSFADTLRDALRENGAVRTMFPPVPVGGVDGASPNTGVTGATLIGGGNVASGSESVAVGIGHYAILPRNQPVINQDHMIRSSPSHVVNSDGSISVYHSHPANNISMSLIVAPRNEIDRNGDVFSFSRPISVRSSNEGSVGPVGEVGLAGMQGPVGEAGPTESIDIGTQGTLVHETGNDRTFIVTSQSDIDDAVDTLTRIQSGEILPEAGGDTTRNVEGLNSEFLQSTLERLEHRVGEVVTDSTSREIANDLDRSISGLVTDLADTSTGRVVDIPPDHFYIMGERHTVSFVQMTANWNSDPRLNSSSVREQITSSIREDERNRLAAAILENPLSGPVITATQTPAERIAGAVREQDRIAAVAERVIERTRDRASNTSIGSTVANLAAVTSSQFDNPNYTPEPYSYRREPLHSVRGYPDPNDPNPPVQRYGYSENPDPNNNPAHRVDPYTYATLVQDILNQKHAGVSLTKGNDNEDILPKHTIGYAFIDKGKCVPVCDYTKYMKDALALGMKSEEVEEHFREYTLGEDLGDATPIFVVMTKNRVEILNKTKQFQ